MSDDFFEADTQVHDYEDLDGEDLAPEEVADAFFSFDEDRYGFRWFGNLLVVGLLVAYLARLAGLVFGSGANVTGLNTDPSAIELLLAAGDVFIAAEAGIVVALAAALVVRFRPINDGVREVLRLASFVVLAGSLGSVLGSYLSDEQISTFSSSDFRWALLHGGGAVAVQATAAIATLSSEREAQRVPAWAIGGLLVSSLMGLASGLLVDFRGVSVSDAESLIFRLSGVGSFDWMPLIVAAVVVSVTGWVWMMRAAVISAAVVASVLALAFLAISVSQGSGEAFFLIDSAAYHVPATLFASLVAIGLVSMPFVRMAPEDQRANSQ